MSKTKSTKMMTVTFKMWRQKDAKSEGAFETHSLSEVSPDMSFLEALDSLNESLTKKGVAPIEFESDCREGICGTCSCVINGQAHGPERGAATCQLYMRNFKDGDTLVVEPWRASAFPVIKDLVVDRSALGGVMPSSPNRPASRSSPRMLMRCLTSCDYGVSRGPGPRRWGGTAGSSRVARGWPPRRDPRAP